MTLGVASFGVTIDKFTERLKRATDGIMQIVLAHKYPQTLHTPLSAGLNLHRQPHATMSNDIIHLSLTALAGVLPIMHLWLYMAVLTFDKFQPGKPFRHSTLVHQIPFRSYQHL